MKAEINICTEDFTIEMQWLLHLLSRRFRGGVPAPRTAPCARRFLQTAQYHRVTTVIADSLVACPPEWMSSPMIQQIQVIQKRSSFRALRRLHALLDLKDEMKSLSLPFINIKGLSLSQKLYGDTYTRSCGDIDFWVTEEAVTPVIECFVKQGFTSKTGFETLHPHYQQKFMRLTNHIGFMNGDTSIELHWRLTPHFRLFPVAFDEAFEASERISIQGHEFNILGPEHLLPHLLVHGACHIWERLHWLTDIAALTQKPSSLLPSSEWSRAHQLHTPLLGGLHLSAALIGHFPPPTWPGMTPEQSGSLKKHLQLSLKQLKMSPASKRRLSARDHFTNQMQLIAGWQAKVSFLKTEFYAPGNWKDLKLPPHLGLLYLFWRPIAYLRGKLGANEGRSPS